MVDLPVAVVVAAVGALRSRVGNEPRHLELGQRGLDQRVDLGVPTRGDLALPTGDRLPQTGDSLCLLVLEPLDRILIAVAQIADEVAARVPDE